MGRYPQYTGFEIHQLNYVIQLSLKIKPKNIIQLWTPQIILEVIRDDEITNRVWILDITKHVLTPSYATSSNNWERTDRVWNFKYFLRWHRFETGCGF